MSRRGGWCGARGRAFYTVSMIFSTAWLSDGGFWHRAGLMLKAVCTVSMVRMVRYAEMFRSSQELACAIGAGSGFEVCKYAYDMYGTVGNEDTECRYDRGLAMVRTVGTVPRERSIYTRGAWRSAGHEERRRTDDRLRAEVLTQAERNWNSDGIKIQREHRSDRMIGENEVLTNQQFYNWNKGISNK